MTDLETLYQRVHAHVLAALTPAGHWRGQLATSALSTATSTVALSIIDPAGQADRIRRGLEWLCANQNADGGWGDTVDARSNINTTTLCWAALALGKHPEVEHRGRTWIGNTIQISPEAQPLALVKAILAYYGDDKTFSVPILSMTALSGRLGDRATAYALLPQLPFELAAFPQSIFRFLRLPVVSYAVPALVAIGQSRHHFARKSWCPLTWIRSACRTRTLALVRRMQPTTGGFLEATPLTSFVSMNLAAMGHQNHPIVQECKRFLEELQREDGGWPIDTDLATWVSTLAVNALAVSGDLETTLNAQARETLLSWLLAQQHRRIHPFTNAAPGGWGWSDRDGSIADADDTPGALLALHALAPNNPEVLEAAIQGITWTLDLANSDGGVPTFCKGWNRLPFDRSAPDITAHCVSAWSVWLPVLPAKLQRRTQLAIKHGLKYLQQKQQTDGSWLPLWFGNEWHPKFRNPAYGTARVLLALARMKHRSAMTDRAVHYLLSAQANDGTCGGGPGLPHPSIEETALTLDALGAAFQAGFAPQNHNDLQTSIQKGIAGLGLLTQDGTHFPAKPIGFYFATLWYSEALYPGLFALEALGRVRSLVANK